MLKMKFDDPRFVRFLDRPGGRIVACAVLGAFALEAMNAFTNFADLASVMHRHDRGELPSQRPRIAQLGWTWPAYPDITAIQDRRSPVERFRLRDTCADPLAELEQIVEEAIGSGAT